MKLSAFEYKLPDKYLAQHPSAERDECKLMLLNRKEETIEHLVFKAVSYTHLTLPTKRIV